MISGDVNVRTSETYSRETVLALQSAVSDLVKSVYGEQDRMLVAMERTNRCPVRLLGKIHRCWLSGRRDAAWVLRVRVFDEEISELAGRVRAASKKSVWAKHIDDAKRSNQLLEKLFEDFNEKVGKVLPKLYQP
jgi:hypothetical protein